MKHTVEKGKTLLVDGPSSVTLLSGEAKVLGAPLKVEERFVIREGKRTPFEVVKKSMFDLVLGENASFEEIDGSTIPSSWENVSEELISERKLLTVMVMGAVDSGKTSFCTYLANKALEKKWKVAAIDADLGQSDVGPPTTIGFSRIVTPVKDLFEAEAESARFIGLTSPSGVIAEVIENLSSLKNIALKSAVDLLIVNTDGWVNGEEAVAYKIKLVEKTAPDIVVGIQHENELSPILNALKEKKVFSVNSPSVIRARDREKRKILRELSYKKYLKDAKIQSFPLNWVNVEGAFFKTKNHPFESTEKIRTLLGTNPVYFEETPTSVFLVLRKGQWNDEELIKEIENMYGKKAKAIREGDEEGLLVAFQDDDGRFLGIGVIRSIDYKRLVMKVFTPVYKNVATILVGQIKLDEKGREIGVNPVFL
jgi:polynucleotide 5'-hydroxyl-kinase GRC3/NOL9